MSQVIEVVNEIVMHFLLSLISNLDFKPLFVPIEANLGSDWFLEKINFPVRKNLSQCFINLPVSFMHVF